jgi:choline dehydrogenase-like flavoprotein
MVAASTLCALSAALVLVTPALGAPTASAQACDPASPPANGCSYDYIVVGGGTAGLALAVRLSEDSRRTVAVVEAGPSAKGVDGVDVPALITTPIGTNLDWQVVTTPQQHSNNHAYGWPRGKMLGGSSGLNYLVWDRASSKEYDAWEKLGNPGWNWNSIFTTIRDKVESYTAPPSAVANDFNIKPKSSNLGTNGPIRTMITPFLPNFIKDWVPTFNKLGVPTQQDPLGGNNVGASLGPSSIDPVTRTRSYAASAYLWPNQNRPNLRVIANATVTKVNLVQSSGSNWKATGINYVPGAKTNPAITINANMEVVLSAGTINTPQLLELSGVGQPAVLQAQGITPKINLPGVGENLQEHQFSALIYELKAGLQTPDLLQFNSTFAAQQMALFKSQQPSLFDSAVTGISYATLPQLVGVVDSAKIIAKALLQATNAGVYQKQYNIQLEQLISNIGQMELILVLG